MVANPETSATYEVFSFIDRQYQNHQIIVVTNLLVTVLCTVVCTASPYKLQYCHCQY